MYRTIRRRLVVVAVIAWIAAVGLACLITTSIVPIQWVAPLMLILAVGMSATVTYATLRAIPERLASLVLGITDEENGGRMHVVHDDDE